MKNHAEILKLAGKLQREYHAKNMACHALKEGNWLRAMLVISPLHNLSRVPGPRAKLEGWIDDLIETCSENIDVEVRLLDSLLNQSMQCHKTIQTIKIPSALLNFVDVNCANHLTEISLKLCTN